jgi:uncharacterized membrane protein
MQTHGLVPLILPVHIAAGGLALVFGYPALFAAKGGRLHRTSGTLFVAAMVVMSLTGALIAALDDPLSISVVAGSLTFYLITTAWLTVRERGESARRLDAAGVVVAAIVCLLAFRSGLALLSTGRPETIPAFIFGVVALLAAAGDLRLMRTGTPRGGRRLARHLWRMCFAMWVAAASFFWGPPGRVPALIYYPALLPIPVLLPIAVMLYWLWRLRGRARVSPSGLQLRHDP